MTYTFLPFITSTIQLLKSELYTSYVLDNCEKDGEVATCIETCESVWFKLLDVNHRSSKRYVEECDPIFQEKYADITYVFC